MKTLLLFMSIAPIYGATILHNGKIEPDQKAEVRGYETFNPTNRVMYELWPNGLRYYRDAYQWDMWNTGDTSHMWDYNFTSYPNNTEVANSNANTMVALCPRNASNILVAVVDSGVKTSHPEFQGNFYQSDDLSGHGTMIAGIIGARGNAMQGISTNAQIVGFQTGFQLSEILVAIQSAIDGGARIINCSWGFATNSPALRSVIEYGRSKGVIFVAATKNGVPINMDLYEDYPAWYGLDNIIVVTATTANDDLYGTYGPNTVHLGAPGRNIVSTHVFTNYMYGTGTSYAVAHVVGSLAVLMQEFPQEDYRALIDRVLSSVDVISSLQGKVTSNGRLNLKKAFLYSHPPPRLTIQVGNLTIVTSSIYPRTLEWSTNLTDWTYFTSVSASTNIPIGMSEAQMFYRLR